MPLESDSTHPNITKLVARLHRSQWIWAGAFASMGWITLSVLGNEYPLAAAPWLIIAVLLILRKEPAYFALIAAQWGLSLLPMLPGLNRFIGPDPLSRIFSPGLVEGLTFAMLRILLLLIAWNQFLFYRILYGMVRRDQHEQSRLDLPEVFPNKARILARIAFALASIAVLTIWGTIFLRTPKEIEYFATFAHLSASFAIGLGVGALFSPMRHHGMAGASVGLGGFAIFSILIMQRYFIR
jgi:hypothetical protein